MRKKVRGILRAEPTEDFIHIVPARRSHRRPRSGRVCPTRAGRCPPATSSAPSARSSTAPSSVAPATPPSRPRALISTFSQEQKKITIHHPAPPQEENRR